MLDVGDTSRGSDNLHDAPPLLSSSALLSSPLEATSGLLVLFGGGVVSALFGGGVVSALRAAAHLSSTLLLPAPPNHCVPTPECSPFWLNWATLIETVDLWLCLPAPTPVTGCL